MSEQLHGAVERITYYNEENGYSVIRLKVAGRPDLVTVVGNLPEVQPGESLRLEGDWASHPQYGRQFKAEWCQQVLPATVEGIKRYLGSGLIKGVGPVTAARIVQRFGADTLRVLDEKPRRLREALGVGPKRAAAIAEAWEEQKHIREVMIFLQGHGVTTNLAVKIYKTYGDDALQVVQEDPYRLARDIWGVGFKTADKIARDLGLPPDAPARVQAGVAYALSQLADEGHVYAPEDELVTEATRLLSVPRDLVGTAIGELDAEERVRRDRLVYPTADDRGAAASQLSQVRETQAVYLAPFYYGEIGVTNRLRDLVESPATRLAPFRSVDWDALLAQVTRDSSIELSSEQREAVQAVLTHKVTVLTGGPGTGKTVSVRTVIGALEALDRRYALCAPTGRAAKRLSEATGRPAKTIHRLLEYSPMDGFRRNAENPLEVDCLIVDEACLTYRQPVLLADGTWQYIGKIVSQRVPAEVLSYNFETGKVEPKRVINWFRYPRKSPFLRINASRSHSLRSARIVKATPRHKIATPSGWVRAEDLRIGDKVLVRGRFLLQFQRSFALGSLLGDTHINTRKGTSPHLQFVHGEDQIEYLRFKAAIFRHHVTREPTAYPSGYAPHRSVWYVHTCVLDDLIQMYELCYPDGEKMVSDEWLSLVDEVGLAAWFLDDGSIQRPKRQPHYALLHTEGFSLAEQETIRRWFALKWDLHPRIDKDSRGYYFLRFTVPDTIRLLDLVRSYTPRCMQWKVGGECCFVPPDEEPPEVAPFVVQSIELWEPTASGHKRYVYDIEVEDNHNYFAGNILVSNSMLDLLLTNNLLKAVDPAAHVLFVGDVDQLPSVGAGDVLRDIIGSGRATVVQLTTIFRQAADSGIVVNAHRINRGQFPALNEFDDFYFFSKEDPQEAARLLVDIVKRRIPHKFGLDPLDDVQVLAPMYRGACGVANLNALLQEALNPASPRKNERRLGGRVFRVGDKVMQMRNNYFRDVYNGDIGRVREIDPVEQTLVVTIDGRPVVYDWGEADELAHAFAVSVHKSQGSEYTAVVMPMLTQHYLLLQRNLLYTGITRAKRLVVLVGTRKAIWIAVRNNKVSERHSGLGVRLAEA